MFGRDQDPCRRDLDHNSVQRFTSSHAVACSMIRSRSCCASGRYLQMHTLELAGLLKFDGQGHASNSYSYSSSDGEVGTGGTSLTYQVAPNCTFTLLQDNGETYAGVIVEGSHELYFVETSGALFGGPIVLRGSATRLWE